MKFISMFLTASAVYIRGLPQIYKQTSEINKVYFGYITASAVYIRDSSQIYKNFSSVQCCTGAKCALCYQMATSANWVSNMQTKVVI